MKRLALIILLNFIVYANYAQTVTYDKVGIGTTPSYPLHIYEQSGEGHSILINAETDANPNIGFQANGQNVANFRYNDSGNDHFQFQFGSDLTPVLNFSMDGRVGLGVTEPRALLDLYETSDHGTSILIDSETNANPNIQFWVNGNAVANLRYDDSGTDHFQIQTGSSLFPAINISMDGKVGIGDVLPTSALTVNGTISAEKIEVTTDIAAAGNISADNLTLYNSVPNSDHVFSSNYNLMDINEVAEYIMQHQHLPEVPSAEEFKENGYSVGQMDDLLLRKIEELTLYIIELKKVNEQQQTQIEELKSLVKQ